MKNKGKTLCEIFMQEKQLRAFITKSKAGHYTVTVKNELKQPVSKVRFIASLQEAQNIAKSLTK